MTFMAVLAVILALASVGLVREYGGPIGRAMR